MAQKDVIIVGAGSVGVPAAMALAEAGFKPIVFDRNVSCGQGDNKHAIGGIRATHGDPAKILACLRSLEIISGWQSKFGDDLEWQKGGYCFPVYREQDEKALRSLLPIQHKHKLDIGFATPEKIAEIVPGIAREGLLGGTFSPGDGCASPLNSIAAFERRARELGARFEYKENVLGLYAAEGKIRGIVTDHGKYEADVVIDAAGAHSRELCQTAGVDIPVFPDCHEGGITEQVEPFFKAMIVDLRPGPMSKNFYFYQNHRGQVIFCVTPEPALLGTDRRETSMFLPQVAQRLIQLMPRFKNLRVRRTWRGLYPMTPDGVPLVGWNKEVKGLLHATGMCGQGFMLGPGIGELLARMVSKTKGADDDVILQGFDPYRKEKKEEALK